MKAEVVHHIPGRVRLRIPELHNCGDLSGWMKGPVLTQFGIQSFRVNLWCASVVITYDPATPDVVNRLLAALEFFTVPTQTPAPVTTPPRETWQAVKATAAAVVGFLGKTHNLIWASIGVAGSLLGGFWAAATAPIVCLTALPSLQRAFHI